MNRIRVWRLLFVLAAFASGLAALPWTDGPLQGIERFLRPRAGGIDLVKLRVFKTGLVVLSAGLALLAATPARWLAGRGFRRLLLAYCVLFGGGAFAGSIRMAALSDRVVVEPDLSEYVAGARSVWFRGWFGFDVNGHRLPSQYPPGMSLALAPFAGTLGAQSAGYGSLCFGVVALVVTALAARRIALAEWAGHRPPDHVRLASVVAAAFLLGSPGALKFFAQPLSEGPSIALVALTGLLCFTGEPTPARAAAVGSAAAAAVAVRYSNVVVLGPLVLFFALARPWSRARILALVGCGAVPLGLLAAYLAATFGSPFRSGYDFWNNDTYARSSFGLGNVLAPNGGDVRLPNLLTYGLELVAVPVNPFTALWLPGTAALAFLALGRESIPRRCARAAGLSLVLTLAMFLTYRFQDSRFLLPLLPLGAMALAAPVAAALESAHPAGRYARLGLLVSSLCLACGIAHGYASWLDTRPSKGEFAADVTDHTEPDAAVVSALDAATFSSFVTGGARRYVPLSNSLAHIHLLEPRGITFGAAEHPDRLVELARGRPVYLDARFASRLPHAYDRLRASLPWRPVGAGSALLRLTGP